MCGICGIYDPSGPDVGSLNKMLAVLAHRGPDDEGIYVAGKIGLGNRRLSIIDLSGGRQPIGSEDGQIQVVFNGEIYNYQSLRQELEEKGHQFRTQSDSEVLVHLYEELDECFVERLNGMFAIALWDGKQGKLILARDRLGQKPLFYTQEGEQFVFASEVKAILAASRRSREINFESVHHYLSLRFIPAPDTMLRHIQKLPPAHLLILQNGRMRVHQYWEFSFRKKLDQPESELLLHLQEQLINSIGSHLVSDVPVGSFLSGGLDSSMIVAIMAKDHKRQFKTFSIGVEEQDFNELPFARMVAERYGTDHIEECVEAGLIQSLPKMIWHLDEPSDPIASCFFQAAELASRHVKVVLGGDGGDELFAGFDRYLAVGLIGPYTWIPKSIRQRVVGPVLNLIPDNFSYKNTAQKLRWVHQLSLLPGLPERYAEATCFFRFNHQDKFTLYREDLRKQVGGLNSSDVIVDQFNQAPAEEVLDRMLYADFKTRLPEHSLMLTDRMTMAHGLEARSPYLDHELVELMAAFPVHLKIQGRTTKSIFRKMARHYLPEQIVWREKQGFMFPIAYWFRNALYPFMREYLANSFFVQEGYFQEQTIQRLIEEHRMQKVDNHVRLWMLLNLEIWHRIFIRQDPWQAVAEEISFHMDRNDSMRLLSVNS